jgi:pyrroline-5-carboxylate reductase
MNLGFIGIGNIATCVIKGYARVKDNLLIVPSNSRKLPF